MRGCGAVKWQSVVCPPFLEFSDVVFRPIELELMTVDSISHEVAL
jgi:hypothetical protein